MEAHPHKKSDVHAPESIGFMQSHRKGGRPSATFEHEPENPREGRSLFPESKRRGCFATSIRRAKERVRETTAGGVLSLLYWSVARHVALDPFPEVLGSRRLLGQPTLDRRFARRFARGAGFPEPVTRSAG